MQTDLRVPGDVNPVERIIEIKDQEIADILEHERQKSLRSRSGRNRITTRRRRRIVIGL